MSSNAENQTPQTALNNYLQHIGKDAALHWSETQTGPRHEVEWTVQCKLDGEVLGTGTGSTKGAARDVAAKVALDALKAQANAQRDH